MISCKRSRTMLGIISFIVVIAGLVTGCLLMMRRHRKHTTLKDGEVNRSEADITLDKVYDDLLDFDSDDETPDKSNTEVTIVPAVMKLKGRSFGSINKGIILSGATIILSSSSTTLPYRSLYTTTVTVRRSCSRKRYWRTR